MLQKFGYEVDSVYDGQAALDQLELSGYGIGLSIAESLVKSMKGSIDVSWNKGRILFTCKF